jgi:DNA-directed RNA polymerase specialized sigma24 family protein
VTPMNQDSPQPQPSAFPQTLWTQVVNALQQPELDQARYDELMALLCKIYWQPLYQFARRKGNSPEHSQDLTQGFFHRVIDQRLFLRADRNKGKLRSYLLNLFQSHIRDVHEKETALKRGGDAKSVSLDDPEQLLEVAAESPTLAVEFEREFAQNLLKQAMATVQADYTKSGKLERYESLKQFISREGSAEVYEAECDRIGVTMGNYKVLVQRFREAFKAALMTLVQHSMDDGATEEEVRAEVLEVIRLAFVGPGA